MKALSSAGLALLVTACGASSSHQRLVADPVNGDLVSVSCDGSQNLCYSEAARACPGGFDVADSTGQVNTRVVPVQNALTKQTTYYSRESYAGSLLVRCRPDAVQPAPSSESKEPSAVMREPGF